jgi:hypothetical protein
MKPQKRKFCFTFHFYSRLNPKNVCHMQWLIGLTDVYLDTKLCQNFSYIKNLVFAITVEGGPRK